ncbi:MAG TPA: SatD family protein [Pseudomonadales bacterium]
MPLLVLIADLVDSRTIPDRPRLQSRLERLLAELRGPGVVSPYTLTLGDEFQAVLDRGPRVFRDALTIQAALHPVLVRFSLAVGELSTEVNRRQAIGMDGPPFHAARAGIDALKNEETLFRVHLPDALMADLANASLALISHAFRRWQTRRLSILSALQHDVPVQQIAERLGITEQAVYKNVSDGHLRDVLAAFDAVGRLLDRALGHPP